MKSFLQGKRTLDIQSLRLPTAPVLAAATEACKQTAAGSPAPQVELVKQGDKIVRLVITCSCGERTEIECLYPPGQ